MISRITNISWFLQGLVIYLILLFIFPTLFNTNSDTRNSYQLFLTIGALIIIWGKYLAYPDNKTVKIIKFIFGNIIISIGISVIGLAVFIVDREYNFWGTIIGSSLMFIAPIGWLVLTIGKRLKTATQNLMENTQIGEAISSKLPKTPSHISVQVITSDAKGKVGEDGELLETSNKKYKIQGANNQITEAIYLEAGRYRLEYKTPIDDSIFVGLVHVDDLEADSENILYESGSGSINFAVKKSGRYALEINAMGENFKWSLECSRL